MIELNRLISIVEKLSGSEMKIISNSLNSTEKKSNTKNYAKEILDLLYVKKVYSDSDIQYKIYGKLNRVAFKKNLQRLNSRILECLIAKEMLFVNDVYDNKSKQVFNIKRKLLYYDVLSAHGVINYALSILNQTIKIAKKIEYYDYLIIALDKKLIKMSLRYGISGYNKIRDEISFYSDCNLSLKRSHYLLRLYSTNISFKNTLISNEQLDLTIKKIRNDFERTKSKSIRINLFYLQGIQLFDKRDYLKCKNNFEQLYLYLNKNQNIIFSSYLITCLINIAECSTMLWNFEYSLTILKNIINKYSKNEVNDKLVKESIFINYYYSGDLIKSTEYITKLLGVTLSDRVSTFVQAKRYFYMASIETINGEFSKSNRILNNCKELDKDRDGWNIGLRLLVIINNIELDKLVFVESQIENLRKHVSRIKDESNFYNRFFIITKILIYLMNNSFDFKLTFKKHTTEFNKLSSKSSLFSWILKSPETIIFHEWFDSKLKGIPYNHTEVMSRLRKANKRG